MMTCVHLWEHFTELSLKLEIFQLHFLGEKHILCSISFLWKSCRLSDSVEKYGGARQATDDDKICRMRFAGWLTNATNTQNMQYLFTFDGNNGFANSPQSYVTRTLPVLLSRRMPGYNYL